MARGRKSSEPRRPPGRRAGKQPKSRQARDFQYRALIPARHEIRLLELLPGKPNSRVKARLFHVSLDDAPHFDALSYMWGRPRPTYDIKLMYSAEQSTSFPIGRNLRRALDNIRFPDRPRVIWVDAICINQADRDERERQVKLIRRIFSTAEKVCAWIDHDVVPTLGVFDDLQELGKSIEIDDFYDAKYWHPVADIFRNPYWRRLWVQQELILAKEIDIYCHRHVFDGQKLLLFQQKVNDSTGFTQQQLLSPVHELGAYMRGIVDENGQRIEAEEFFFLRLSNAAKKAIQKICLSKEHVSKRLWEHLFFLYRSGHVHYRPGTFFGGISSARSAISGARWRIQSTSGLDLLPQQQMGCLLDLFTQSLHLMMTDPRDRVYGILGIATDTDPDDVIVDYTMPLSSVFSQVFQLHIKRYKSLSFLCMAPVKRRDFLPDHKFPSWMPVRQSILGGIISACNASGGLKADNAWIDTETYVLSVEGVMVDTISFVGNREPIDILPVTYWLEKLEHYCERLWPRSKDHRLYEREDVIELLFPLLNPDVYRSIFEVEKPTPEHKLDVVRSLVRASSRADCPGFSLNDVIDGNYTPSGLFTPEERERCTQLYFGVLNVAFLGTEGGRLGTIQFTADAAAGDQIWIILGCEMPMILRPVKGMNGRYCVVGPVIIQGLIYGQGLKGLLIEDEGRISPEYLRQIGLQ
ncbi:heterokaryon incompatibility protein-domain-containing protein [Nemania sp. FL0916]|nr:heterokaryon incompatibility protein-domain-containing protein [Nemania sp. FL0916]